MTADCARTVHWSWTGRKHCPRAGVLYVGSQGKLITDYSGGKPLLLPESRFKDFVAPAPPLERSKGHYKEWVQAAKTGSATNCPFSVGGRMAEVALLGTVAPRAARYLEWDPVQGKITNDPQANSWVDRTVRAGRARDRC